MSDNGKQLKSSDFADFCKRNAVEDIPTTLYNPQSNGQAEKFVDILKRALLKMEGEIMQRKLCKSSWYLIELSWVQSVKTEIRQPK